ncbi:MAG: MopE-related protein [Sandaracinaceae bacterium]|nr:MopE-related protein [Sandaracinaceae bacterium]
MVVDADGDGAGPAACVEAYCTDDDGTCASRDCDDSNASVHPGATELCNGVDDDCNGLFDGPDEDDDRDGHADRCAGAAASDCDDEDASTYVGAPELCDGLDNDCFSGGLVRTVGGPLAEPAEDRDGDGHAPPDAACEGGSLPRDDCDDAQPSVHAGAPERCDGLDNDCNGVPDDARTGEPGTSCLPIDITAGDAHSCVRTADLGVVCWGAADFRLAGSNLDEDREVVAGTERVAGDERYLDVAAGQDGTCAVVEGGDVRCWGSPALVSPELRVPRDDDRLGRVLGVAGATRVVAGWDHACAIVPEGVECWGESAHGAVDGEAHAEPIAPSIIAGTEGSTDLDTSLTHTCAVVGGRVVCWGDAASGALGGMPEPGEATVVVPSIGDAVEVAVGHCFTCVRHEAGGVSCFGDARYEDDVDFRAPCTGPFLPLPRRVPGLGAAVSIDAYVVHACAALDTGEVYCWGNNTTRQLGDGTPLDATHPREGFDRGESAPVRVVGVDDATQVALGTWHSCALGPNGASCWGRQARHRLGNGRFDPVLTADSPRPFALPVSVIRGPVEIAAGRRGTCLRMPDLTVRCAGAPTDAAPPTCYAVPHEVEGWANVLSLRASGRALCAITGRLAPGEGGIVDRVVRCVGPSISQQFLQAAGPDGIIPLETGPASLALGLRHACVLDGEGIVRCWGVHDLGQLGTEAPVTDACPQVIGDPIGCSLSPLRVELSAAARAIAAGVNHTCALLAGGEVECWGNNDLGQLGRAPLTNVGAVGLVEGLPVGDPVRALAAAGETTCAILESRQVWCWGQSVTSVGMAAWPRHVVELGSAEQLAILSGFGGTLGICARLSTGLILCTGRNVDGHVGGTAPVCPFVLPAACPFETAVSRFDDAVDLACGFGHCCATRGSGQVVCWGRRSEGQCADGVVDPDFFGTASTIDLIAYDAVDALPACETATAP